MVQRHDYLVIDELVVLDVLSMASNPSCLDNFFLLMSSSFLLVFFQKSLKARSHHVLEVWICFQLYCKSQSIYLISIIVHDLVYKIDGCIFRFFEFIFFSVYSEIYLLLSMIWSTK